MSTAPPTITRLSDLFTSDEVEGIDKAPLRPNGTRHPTWFALCSREPRPVDNLVRI